MFFCTPINNRISYEGYEGLYGYEKYDYSKFMFAPFYMIFKYKNYGSFPGKVEFYPYMIIMLTLNYQPRPFIRLKMRQQQLLRWKF